MLFGCYGVFGRACFLPVNCTWYVLEIVWLLLKKNDILFFLIQILSKNPK